MTVLGTYRSVESFLISRVFEYGHKMYVTHKASF